jgi:hypothetical protein
MHIGGGAHDSAAAGDKSGDHDQDPPTLRLAIRNTLPNGSRTMARLSPYGVSSGASMLVAPAARAVIGAVGVLGVDRAIGMDLADSAEDSAKELHGCHGGSTLGCDLLPTGCGGG